MRDAGFINTQVLRFKGPIGPWPKDKMLREAGLYNLVAMLDGLDGLSARAFQGALGWSVEQFNVFNALTRTDLKRKHVHHYWPT